MLNNKIKKQKGFSLVEMLVAVGIFMSIMTIAISSLISIIGANKKAQAIKSTIDSVTFAVEDISRDMRVGTDYTCSLNGSFPVSGKDCTEGGSAVQYKKSNNDIVTYRFYDPAVSANSEKDVLTRQINNDAEIALVSKDSNVDITSMKFYVIGADNEFSAVTAKTQPRVIITASGLISVKGSSDTTFNLQTSISQRARR